MKCKKILSCALALMLSLGTLTVLPEQFNDKIGVAITADAAANDLIICTDNDGMKYVDGYKGNGGDVVIPKDVSYINEKAFEGVTNITSVTAEGDLYVWKEGFKGCTRIKKLTIKGDAYFAQSAFAYCASLENVDINGSIYEVIGGDAFSHCTMLRNFRVKGSKYDYEIGEDAFYNCINLTKVDIAKSCTQIHNEAFLNCIKLSSLTIPEKTKFYTSKGSKHVGYSWGYYSEDDFYNDEPYYFFNIDPTALYVYYYTYSKPSYGWTTKTYGLYSKLEKFSPCKITLDVYKGSNAESFAKKNKIPYRIITEDSENDVLASPDNIRLTGKTKNSITLKWDKVSGADAYNVYLYNSTTGKYVKYKTVKSNSCVIKSLKKNTKYKFKISALDKVDGKYVEGEKSDPVSATTKK